MWRGRRRWGTDSNAQLHLARRGTWPRSRPIVRLQQPSPVPGGETRTSLGRYRARRGRSALNPGSMMTQPTANVALQVWARRGYRGSGRAGAPGNGGHRRRGSDEDACAVASSASKHRGCPRPQPDAAFPPRAMLRASGEGLPAASGARRVQTQPAGTRGAMLGGHPMTSPVDGLAVAGRRGDRARRHPASTIGPVRRWPGPQGAAHAPEHVPARPGAVSRIAEIIREGGPPARFEHPRSTNALGAVSAAPALGSAGTP